MRSKLLWRQLVGIWNVIEVDDVLRPCGNSDKLTGNRLRFVLRDST